MFARWRRIQPSDFKAKATAQHAHGDDDAKSGEQSAPIGRSRHDTAQSGRRSEENRAQRSPQAPRANPLLFRHARSNQPPAHRSGSPI